MRIVKYIRERYSCFSLPVRAGICFTVCNLSLKGLSFISAPIFTRVLSPGEYGFLSILITYQDIILTLATWQIALSAYQKGIFKFKYDIKFFSGVTQLVSSILTVIFFTLVFCFFPMFSLYTGFDCITLVCLFVYMLFEPSFSCWLILKRSNYEYKTAVIMTFINSFMAVFIPLCVVIYVDCSAVARFRAGLISSCIVFSYFYYKQLYAKKIFKNIKKAIIYCKYIVNYQFPIVIHALSYTLLAQFDRIMIGNMIGSTEVAYYTIAYNIGAVALIFQASISQVLVPWRFDKLQNKDYNAIKKNTRIIVAGMGILILAFILISPEIMKIMFTQNYYEAVWSIPPIAVGVYFMFLYSMFVWVENYYEKTSYVALVSVICSFINIFLNYISIPIFGYIACGYTTAISYMCFSFGHYYFMKKACKISGIFEEIYDIRSFIVISFLFIVLSFGMTSLYSYIWIRYILMGILLVSVYIKRREVVIYIHNFI